MKYSTSDIGYRPIPIYPKAYWFCFIDSKVTVILQFPWLILHSMQMDWNTNNTQVSSSLEQNLLNWFHSSITIGLKASW